MADVLFPESRSVVGTETLNRALKLDSYISIVKALEPAGKRKGSTGVVAEYLKEPVQVVHSATPLAVHPMKDRLAGESVHGWSVFPLHPPADLAALVETCLVVSRSTLARESRYDLTAQTIPSYLVVEAWTVEAHITFGWLSSIRPKARSSVAIPVPTYLE